MSLEKASFGMGCFWSPEALFGSTKGVKRTKVGYSGGEKDDPDYHHLGRHTETVQIEFDPEIISYDELLEIFWGNHDFGEKRKDQYRSVIFFHSESQRKKAEGSMRENTETDLEPMTVFYDAENYHQKFRLRHSPLADFFDSPEEIKSSELAARLNAFAGGKLTKKELDELIELPAEIAQKLD
ncbi:MAG: peptide-methionine (S)-S-oxide reductase [Nanohaloarchaea archaeon]|nr:peptide-methionine (S)-S-oxide reductase [Candidatus Nanohaloarchaea archaeon]